MLDRDRDSIMSTAKMMDWSDSIDLLRDWIVKIATPRGSGTGFVITCSMENRLYGIATAAHVLNDAHYWEEPIRITHFTSGKSFVFRYPERAIFLRDDMDTAALVIKSDDPVFPPQSLPLVPEQMSLRVGKEVGWLGFPSVSPDNLCFFSGKASCWMVSQNAYLIDGVAINGVSGGPAFHLGEHFPVIIGIASAYLPNRVVGATLPGLSIVRDVKQFHDLAKTFKSMDEAKRKETPPVSPESEPPPALSETRRTDPGSK